MRLVYILTVVLVLAARPALSQIPDDTLSARYELAETYLQAGQFDRATALLEDLYAAQPETYLFFDRLREAYESAERYDDAILLVEGHMQRQPENTSLFSVKARLLYLKGDEPGAFDAWDDAISADSDSRNTYLTVYQTMFDLRLTDQAIAVLERGREALGDESVFLTDLAYLYSTVGRHEEAVSEYLKLLAASERQLSFIRSRLSRFMEDPQALQAGIAAAEQGVRREPSNRAIRELLAWFYLEAGDYRKALEINREIDRLGQESGRVLLLFAQSAVDAGAYDIAAEAFAEVVSIYPDSPAAPDAQFNLALMNERWAAETGEQAVDASGERVAAPHYERALEGYRIFMQQYPSHEYFPEALRRTGVLQQDVFRNYSEARATLQEVIRRYPMTEAAHTSELQMGRIQLLDNQFSLAKQTFSDLIDRLGVGSLADQARYELALVHFYEGEFDAARALTEELNQDLSGLTANDAIELKVLLLENTGPDSLSTPLRTYARAHLLDRQHRAEQAITVLDSLLQQYGNHSLADESRFLRARALRNAGRPEEAVAAFLELPLMHPASFLADRSLFLAAETQEKDMDDPAAAVETYTKLLTDYPGTLYAADARARIRVLRTAGV
jgi:cellulose synthase operon protein C